MQKKPILSIVKPQNTENSLLLKNAGLVNSQLVAKHETLKTHNTLMDQVKKPYFAPESNVNELVLEPYCASGNNWDGKELPGFEFND